jgi:hypothetical protein
MNNIIAGAFRQLASASIAALVTGVLHWMLATPHVHAPRYQAATVQASSEALRQQGT